MTGATEPYLTLDSGGLLSKWGFNDGDPPDVWLDYCAAHGIDDTEVAFPLVELVRTFLLPRIEQTVTVVEIGTAHNPIRVDTVDGVDVTEVWFGRAPAPLLTPDEVDVPMTEVLRLALAKAG
ncbi:hypothetical protein [Streptomyces sp. NPDC058045]|uniref:hypothetical protein n=1 Tax=Streptomyces sp. NPDC058045 TaxID=3346311 RepID=UPI0036EB33A9